MVYIIAGATGVVGSAISKELAKENEVHLIGRDEAVSYTHLRAHETQ